MLRRVAAAAAALHFPPPPRSRLLCTHRHVCTATKAVDLTAVREFWEQKGALAQQEVSRLVAFAAARPVLQQPAKLQEKLDGLRTVLGLDEPAVVQMAAASPTLLLLAAPTKNKPSALATNFRALQARFSAFDVLNLVRRRPHLLTTRASTVERKLSLLAELLPGVDVASMAYSWPPLLGLKDDTVRKNAKGLMERFSKADAIRMLSGQPTLLGSNFEETVGPNFDRFRDVFGAQCAQRVCKTRPQLLALDFHRSVVPKIAELAELLECSEPEAKGLLRRVPLLFGRNLSNLSGNVEALVQTFQELGSETPKEDFRTIVHRYPDVIRCRARLVAHRVERLVTLAGSKARARDAILTCPQLLTRGLGVWNRVAFANASGLRLGVLSVVNTTKAALPEKLPGYHDFLVARAIAQWDDWHSQLRRDTRFRVHFAKRLLGSNTRPSLSEIATALDSLPQAFARLELGDLESTVNDMELVRANATVPTTEGWGD